MAQRRQLQSELPSAEERLSTTERHIDAIHDDGPRLKKTKVDDDSSFPLLSLGSDLLIRCVSYLDPNGMVQLGCTSTLFGRIQPGCQRSFVNRTAHQVFLGASEHEQDALPKYANESDVKLYRELLSLRQALIFSECSPDVQISDMGMRQRMTKHSWGTSFGSQVMRGGKHFVRFPITNHVEDDNICALIGVVRPLSWGDYAPDLYSHALVDIRASGYFSGEIGSLLLNETMSSVRCGGSDIHCCAYTTMDGYWHSTNWRDRKIMRQDWPGREEMREPGEIAMLLDLGAGTLTIYKNGRQLGIVQEGLAGEYSWLVQLGCNNASVGIERGHFALKYVRVSEEEREPDYDQTLGWDEGLDDDSMMSSSYENEEECLSLPPSPIPESLDCGGQNSEDGKSVGAMSHHSFAEASKYSRAGSEDCDGDYSLGSWKTT